MAIAATDWIENSNPLHIPEGAERYHSGLWKNCFPGLTGYDDHGCSKEGWDKLPPTFYKGVKVARGFALMAICCGGLALVALAFITNGILVQFERFVSHCVVWMWVGFLVAFFTYLGITEKTFTVEKNGVMEKVKMHCDEGCVFGSNFWMMLVAWIVAFIAAIFSCCVRCTNVFDEVREGHTGPRPSTDTAGSAEEQERGPDEEQGGGPEGHPHHATTPHRPENFQQLAIPESPQIVSPVSGFYGAPAPTPMPMSFNNENVMSRIPSPFPMTMDDVVHHAQAGPSMTRGGQLYRVASRNGDMKGKEKEMDVLVYSDVENTEGERTDVHDVLIEWDGVRRSQERRSTERISHDRPTALMPAAPRLSTTRSGPQLDILGNPRPGNQLDVVTAAKLSKAKAASLASDLQYYAFHVC